MSLSFLKSSTKTSSKCLLKTTLQTEKMLHACRQPLTTDYAEVHFFNQDLIRSYSKSWPSDILWCTLFSLFHRSIRWEFHLDASFSLGCIMNSNQVFLINDDLLEMVYSDSKYSVQWHFYPDWTSRKECICSDSRLNLSVSDGSFHIMRYKYKLILPEQTLLFSLWNLNQGFTLKVINIISSW